MVGELVPPERCDFGFSKEASSEEPIDSIEDGARCRFRTCILTILEAATHFAFVLFDACHCC